ncbi:3-phosphoserine/phosphohydroxythreonine transaminase [Beggiatoa alba]|nr:3-phosphoserine/phosphohydroxythreonine transaminase [Beggiatoa alba]
MSRVYNFSAGPAMLPEAVLKQAQQEMLDWNGCGMSVMEMSHRSKEYLSIAEKAKQDFIDLMSIPDSHEVLFLQGGASSQFAMVPLNLLAGKTQADYVNTGAWSKKAIAEAKRYCNVNVVASSEQQNFTNVPAQANWDHSENAAYLHYTPNETIGGVEFPFIPDVSIPLVADMSSTIMSRPVDVSRFAVIYAGAQKNIGPAGLTMVIVQKELIGHAAKQTPSMFDYSVHAKSDSMNNTPPTYAWYLAGLVFAWMKQQGGLDKMAQINERKANKLYAAIDGSDFYANPVDPSCRSWMNVPFTLADAALDPMFLEQAKKENLITLKGHRSVGGMRASIYNAMPESGVDALVAFMLDFEKRNG